MKHKAFDLITQLYSDMTKQFMALNRKLDQKSDKSDIVRIEKDFSLKTDALMDGYKQLSEGQEKNNQSIQSLQTESITKMFRLQF